MAAKRTEMREIACPDCKGTKQKFSHARQTYLDCARCNRTGKVKMEFVVK